MDLGVRHLRSITCRPPSAKSPLSRGHLPAAARLSVSEIKSTFARAQTRNVYFEKASPKDNSA